MMHHRSLSWKWSSSRSGHPLHLSSSICDVCCARILKSLFLPSICSLRMDAIMFQKMSQKNTESRLSYSCSIHRLKILCGGDIFENNSSERESQVLFCGTVFATIFVILGIPIFFRVCDRKNHTTVGKGLIPPTHIRLAPQTAHSILKKVSTTSHLLHTYNLQQPPVVNENIT